MRSIVLLLLLCPFAHAQTLTLPAEVKGQPGSFISIPAKTDGKVVRWVALDSGLQLFPVELLKDSKTAVATGPAGVYRLLAYTSVKDTPSEPAVCRVVIGVPPPPVPIPDPVDPKPVDPAPIALPGLRVLVVYEATDGAPLLTRKQSNELYSADFRSWLDANCVKDGKTADWRVWDKDVSLANVSEMWRQAMGKVTQTPGILISNGTTGYVGPLPDGGILDLIKKYEVSR